jgi:hypothetical protein
MGGVGEREGEGEGEGEKLGGKTFTHKIHKK